jgi:hypothetical protein
VKTPFPDENHFWWKGAYWNDLEKFIFYHIKMNTVKPLIVFSQIPGIVPAKGWIDLSPNS